MNKSKTIDIVMNVVLFVLSIALFAGVKAVFHACGPMEDGKWMTCHWAEQAVYALGGSLTVTAVIMLCVKGSARKQGLALAMIPQAIAAAFIPNGLINLCMMTDMRCHSVMKPAVIIISVIIAICAAVYVILGLKNKAEE